MVSTIKLLMDFNPVVVKCKNTETNLMEVTKPLGQVLLHCMSGLNVKLAR